MVADILRYTALLAVSVFVYWNTLQAGFVFDDHRAILSNKDIETDGDRTIWDLLQNDFWGGAMSREQSHKSYRPITVLSYRYFNYWFYGRKPISYHFVNIVLHGLASMVAYTLACHVIKDKNFAFFASLLFSVHSIHTEAVANTVGRAEILSSIFYISAILVYRSSIYSQTHSYALTFLSFALSALSMLSKEQGITSIGICIAIDALIHWNILISLLYKILQRIGFTTRLDVANNDTPLYPTLYGFTIRSIILSVLGGLLIVVRIKLNHGSQPIFNETELRIQFHNDATVRAMSFGYLYAFNSWLLLCPYTLCCDWTHPSIPPVLTLLDPRNACFPILIFALSASVYKGVINREDRFPLGMSLAMIIVPFLPASGLLFKVGFVIAERVLYLPSIGYCYLIGYGALRVYRSLQLYPTLQRLVALLCLQLLLTQAIRTLVRNDDWLSDINLYRSGVKFNPNNPKMHNNYGMELKSAGETSAALEQYEQTLLIEPDYSDTYFNIGNLYADEGKLEEALENFMKAATYTQMRPKTLNNLATMYMKLGRLREAESLFLEQIAMNPHHNMAHNNLASLYAQTGRLELSKQHFMKALEIHPNYAEGHFNLGTLMYQLGKLNDAEYHLRKAVAINPKHKGAVNNLKVVLHAKQS